MGQTIFKGAGVALVTPMKKDFSIDYAVLETLIEDQIANHTDAIVVAGTTGEASTLTTQEQIDVIRFTAEVVDHRIPVIAGAGSNNTAHAIELSKQASAAGSDALLHVTPYYNKTSQRGLVQHFSAIADAVNKPIILYNIPSRTGMNILPETYEKLAVKKNIIAVKEASGDFSQLAKISSLYGDRFDIYSGNDDQITSALAIGAKGVISVLSNVVPNVVHEICESFFQHDTDHSDILQMRYLRLIEALFSDVNPIAVKSALNHMGIRVGECRLPLYKMDPTHERNLVKVLKLYNLYKK